MRGMEIRGALNQNDPHGAEWCRSRRSIERARATKSWLRWAGDPSILFSPDELEKAQDAGRFCHGDDNFYVVEEETVLRWHDEAVKKAEAERAKIMRRMGR